MGRFFTRFQFSITYSPGTKNIKADALSHLHGPEETPENPEPILPSSLFVSPIQWSLDEELTATNASKPTQPGCPPDHTYIPHTQRLPLIRSAYSSLGTGHPRTNQTLLLLRDRFWWPNMARDVRRYVQGCAECAMSKTPSQLSIW